MGKRISLGIHLGHDRSAALVSQGILIGNVAQERLDRQKHSPSPNMPFESIDAVLRDAKVNIGDIGCVGFSYTNVAVESILPQLIDEFYDYYALEAVPCFGIGHHRCHAAASYFTSEFQKSLILIADGAGDIVDGKIEAESLYEGKGRNINLVAQRLQDFGMTYMWRRNSFNLAYMDPLDRVKQISLGRKYEQFTYALGFRHGEAGKTMGLAPYGEPLLDLSHYRFHSLDFSLTFSEMLVEIEELRRSSGLPYHVFVSLFGADIACTAQQFVERAVISLLNSLNPCGRWEHLCLGGGLFLNCVLNHKILGQTKFRRIHIMPASGDDGQAVGAALEAYRRRWSAIRNYRKSLPYLGTSYTRAQITKTLNHFGSTYQRMHREKLVKALAAILADGHVLGLLRGRTEIGPRALCHRSILADPRDVSMWHYLNKYVKYREDFRPFAPVVLADQQFKIFELKQESPYMLLAANVREEFRQLLGAVTHVDGSARVQSVTDKQDWFMSRLLREFGSLTGIPVLLNTSFNIANEPIVETPHDALSTFLRTDIDVLCIEDFLVWKRMEIVAPYISGSK